MGEDLQELSALVDERKLTVEVARTFPLEGAADAYRLNMDDHTPAKIVVTIDSSHYAVRVSRTQILSPDERSFTL